MLMHMAQLTRRLQVLLDDARFARLEEEARRSGTTVAAVVRDALDHAYPPRAVPPQEAARRLLARPPIDLGTWEDTKAEVEDALERGARA